ncbi:MAG: amino acid adenylation domain-containing protein [Acetobacteraceae bacterium]|nr:amino acid adenylation domain-containing protein [Acetobacteraceae bacterium]
MTVDAFLRDLQHRGVELRAEGDALSLRAPKGVLTEADRDRLRAEKAAILACLTAPTDDTDPFPLTDIQQAYLIGRAAELELGRVGCHAYREFDRPDVDLPRLERAWNQVVARHPMLRAVFTEDGRQHVLPDVPSYAIEVLDLRDAADADATLAALRADRSHRVFDPTRWPLFDIHATLLPDRVRLSVGIDLLVADAAALITLFREWGALHDAPDSVLPAPAGRFADHVRRLPAPAPADRAYWDARLDTLPPGPDLPRLPVTGPSRFARRSVRLGAPRWRALKQAAAGQGLTASALVAAVYADILAAWSRRARFSLVLTQFAAPPGMVGVVGDFTSTILLEVDSAAPHFRDRALALQRRLVADLDHAGQSGVAVLRDLRRHRPDFEPVSVVFTSTLGHPGLDPDAPSPLAWLGTTVHAITQTPQVAMDHHVLEEAGALVAAWDVVEALFPAGVLDAMVIAYGALLDDLADGTGWDRRVGYCAPCGAGAGSGCGSPSLLEGGGQGGGVDHARTHDPSPRPWCALRPKPSRGGGGRALLHPGPASALLHAAFERQAAATPDRPAIIAPDRTIGYATLERAATRLAARIAPLAWRDQLVAVEQPKGWRQVLAVLAILKAGAAYLPVDPALPAERRRHLIAQTEAIQLDPAWLDTALDGPVPVLPPVTDPTRLAYVIYTSGSTGQPKGVMIEHQAAVTTVAEINRRWSLAADDRVFGLSSLSFDLSVWDIFGPLSAGGALVLPAPDAARDPAAWSTLLAGHRVTVWNSVPALMAMQVEHGLPPDHMLRLVMMSGDWVPLSLVHQLRTAAPKARLVALGGATEAAIWSNAHEIGDLDPAWPSVPYGTPLAGQMLRVANERGEDCPDWVTGEIQIAGAGLARGYWRDPERTAERFVRNPVTGERRYRTGDLGRFRPYGEAGPTPVEFLGREDFQVKVQGHRIELGEIETVLATHPDVAQAVVAALPQGGDKALHAFVVPRGQAWERARFLLERHGLRRLPEAPRFDLPARPDVAVYDERRSVRRFTPEVARLDALAAMLAAVTPGLTVDVVALRVDGLAPGLWRLDPAAHALRRIGDAPACVVPDAGTARVAANAAFLVLLEPGRADRDCVAGPAPIVMAGLDPAMTMGVGDGGRPGQPQRVPDTLPQAHRNALLAAGVAGQRMMCAAQAVGLGLCPIGVLHRDGVPVLHSFAGGAPAAETAGFDLAGALREHAAAQLPAWMVPRHIHLLEALPLSANGKLDRTALQPPSEAETATADGALAAQVGALVAEVIGQPVHPQQNLFDCGATSLHIVRLQRRLAEQLGSKLAVVDLFRLPSVAALAGAIAGEAGPDAIDAGLARAARRRQMNRRGAA